MRLPNAYPFDASGQALIVTKWGILTCDHCDIKGSGGRDRAIYQATRESGAPPLPRWRDPVAASGDDADSDVEEAQPDSGADSDAELRSGIGPLPSPSLAAPRLAEVFPATASSFLQVSLSLPPTYLGGHGGRDPKPRLERLLEICPQIGTKAVCFPFHNPFTPGVVSAVTEANILIMACHRQWCDMIFTDAVDNAKLVKYTKSNVRLQNHPKRVVVLLSQGDDRHFRGVFLPGRSFGEGSTPIPPELRKDEWGWSTDNWTRAYPIFVPEVFASPIEFPRNLPPVQSIARLDWCTGWSSGLKTQIINAVSTAYRLDELSP